MSASSNLAVLESVSADPLAADDSVSAYRAWAVRNNLAHLIDSSTQVRINWVGSSINGESNDTYKVTQEYEPVGEIPPLVTDASTKRIWSQEFPITWIREDRPVNLDLHVRAATRGDTTPALGVSARVVPANYPIGDTGAPAFAETVTATSIDDEVAVVVADVQMTLTVPAPELDNYEPLGGIYEEDGVWHTPRMAMMRLEISLDESTSVVGAVHEIVSVYLREYA